MTMALLPALTLMLITILVWLYLIVLRVGSLNNQGLDPNNYPTPESLNSVLSDREQAPGNCFRNLFEVPMIFYALTGFVLITSNADSLFMTLAWVFVGFRALQVLIHCTYNIVMHRFAAFLISSIILWIMVVRFFLAIY
jgi:hypothetical protein